MKVQIVFTSPFDGAPRQRTMVVHPQSCKIRCRLFNMVLNAKMAPASPVLITLTIGDVEMRAHLQTPYAGDHTSVKVKLPDMLYDLHGNHFLDNGIRVFAATHLHINLARLQDLDRLLLAEDSQPIYGAVTQEGSSEEHDHDDHHTKAHDRQHHWVRHGKVHDRQHDNWGRHGKAHDGERTDLGHDGKAHDRQRDDLGHHGMAHDRQRNDLGHDGGEQRNDLAHDGGEQRNDLAHDGGEQRDDLGHDGGEQRNDSGHDLECHGKGGEHDDGQRGGERDAPRQVLQMRLMAQMVDATTQYLDAMAALRARYDQLEHLDQLDQ